MSGTPGHWLRRQTREGTRLQPITHQMLQPECPFCNPDPTRVFLEAELIFGLWDGFPVAAGHALLVTRRHVASWFDATALERQALSDAIHAARQKILQRHR